MGQVAALPSRSMRHLLSRFSYGVTPALVRQAVAGGGELAWFERQLTPGKVPDAAANAMRAWYPQLDYEAGDRYDAQDTERSSWEQMMDLGRWTALRRTFSKRQLHEVMVEFWSNLLHVPLTDDKSWPHRADYDAMIRARALGTYADLLVAATTHPAMGCYLDNAVSTKSNVNENLGRELLELHSVGVDAGYTEAMVRDSARILTGYRVDMWDSWTPFYATVDHATGPVNVLGFADANESRDGRAVTERYLRYLAAHPATARRLARRLAVHFVSDNPSDALVGAVARAYTTSGTSIRATLRALVAHPDFAASVGAKVRTPGQDAIASYRALGLSVQPPTDGNNFGYAVIYQLGDMDQMPFGWPAPNGFPDVGAAWSSVGRVLASLNLHRTIAHGWWPSTGVTFRPWTDWLPALPATLGEVVDSASTKLLCRPADAATTTACCQLIGMDPSRVVSSANDLGAWRLNPILQTLLNSPAHAAR